MHSAVLSCSKKMSQCQFLIYMWTALATQGNKSELTSVWFYTVAVAGINILYLFDHAPNPERKASFDWHSVRNWNCRFRWLSPTINTMHCWWLLSPKISWMLHATCSLFCQSGSHILPEYSSLIIPNTIMKNTFFNENMKWKICFFIGP